MVAPSSTSHGFPLDITNIGVSVIVGEKSTSINPNMVIVRRVPPIAPSLIKYVLSCSRDTRDSRESRLGHSRQMEERSRSPLHELVHEGSTAAKDTRTAMAEMRGWIEGMAWLEGLIEHL